MHALDAFVRVLQNQVGRIVHNVRVVARSTCHGVCTRAAVKQVIAAIGGQDIVTRQTQELIVAFVADQRVVQVVAGSVDAVGTGQGQMFYVGGKRVADRGVHRVGACTRRLGYRIADVVHNVSVVASITTHGISTRATVQNIGAAVADDGVGKYVACGIGVSDTCQCQIFDIA